MKKSYLTIVIFLLIFITTILLNFSYIFFIGLIFSFIMWVLFVIWQEKNSTLLFVNFIQLQWFLLSYKLLLKVYFYERQKMTSFFLFKNKK